MKKDKIFMPEPFILNRFDVRRDILVNPASIILSQKLITILGRKRKMGRDFFDVSFLWGQTMPNYEYIKALTGMDRRALFDAIRHRCGELDFVSLALVFRFWHRLRECAYKSVPSTNGHASVLCWARCVQVLTFDSTKSFKSFFRGTIGRH